MGSKVIIPDIETAVFDGRDTIMPITGAEQVRMVIFYDSTVCSSCKVSQIWNWEKVITTSKALRGKFAPVFIFSPGEGNVAQLKVSLRTYPFEWPVFIDSTGEFVKQNPHIPADNRLHTFLLDGNDEVILVGDPTGNEKLWELYKTTIKEILGDDGQ
jgi:hypothetical protein